MFRHYVLTVEQLCPDRKTAAVEILRLATDMEQESTPGGGLVEILAWGSRAGWTVAECSIALRRLAARNYLTVTGAEPSDTNLARAWRTLQ